MKTRRGESKEETDRRKRQRCDTYFLLNLLNLLELLVFSLLDLLAAVSGC